MSASARWSPATALDAPGSPADPKKIEIGTRDHSENRPKSPLDPDFHPVVVKIAKNDFLGRFGTKNGPRMVSESVRLGSPSPPKIDLVKNFPIQISISSKKPPTPGWLGVPKMHLTRKKIFSKAFYQAAVRAAGGVAYGPYFSSLNYKLYTIRGPHLGHLGLHLTKNRNAHWAFGHLGKISGL